MSIDQTQQHFYLTAKGELLPVVFAEEPFYLFGMVYA